MRQALATVKWRERSCLRNSQRSSSISSDEAARVGRLKPEINRSSSNFRIAVAKDGIYRIAIAKDDIQDLLGLRGVIYCCQKTLDAFTVVKDS